ncbi:response regulator transcription factor [Pendulispora albinea]|uniref:Response regulator n=1 Tax=Pendulispora albinea TaxID=2741071 RepID=A0ABZ2LPH8_9BACT
MPKTLLAVDDSVTMRKVLEITFSGEDYRVITADGRNAALAALGEQPHAVVVDTVLSNEDGYALAKDLRQRLPGAAIVLLASRHNPYDAGRGKDAGADDFIDKPFDTQQFIDKVKKALAAKEAAGIPAAAPAIAPAAPVAAPPAPSQPRAAAAAPAAPAAQQRPSPRSPTLVFGQEPPAAPPAPSASAKPFPASQLPTSQLPTSQPTPAASPASGSTGVTVSTAVNGHLAGKLDELGLSPQQADAVLALSRDVVEKVVWEVVPQLAETLIKEEIARLTRD